MIIKCHKRSCSFSRYEDFRVDSKEDLKVSDPIEEISTKGTPFRETPIQNPTLMDLSNLMQLLSSNIDEEALWKEKQKKELREMLLILFNKDKDVLGLKKKRKNNNSVGKVFKGTVKAATARNQKNFPKIKVRKLKPFGKKESESPTKSLNAGKKRTRTLRSGSNEIN
jgi:hypothetical protein